MCVRRACARFGSDTRRDVQCLPYHKTIADFRKDNGRAIRKVCARFVELCREIDLLTSASIATDGSKFKAVNNRDRNFTRAKAERRRAQLEESVARYLSRPAGADGGAGREGNKAYRETDEAEGGNGQAYRLREADACFA